jgi:SNF2 family DNA or RNA helicase
MGLGKTVQMLALMMENRPPIEYEFEAWLAMRALN